MTYQQELDLEYAETPDSYTIEVRKGPMYGEEIVWSGSSKAQYISNFLEQIRNHYASNEVVWRDEKFSADGNLYGLRKGETWVISVQPPPVTA